MQEKSFNQYNFPEICKQMLKEKGISQKELAALTGLTEVTISRYMKGVTKPSCIELLSISRILGEPMEKLMTVDFVAEPKELTEVLKRSESTNTCSSCRKRRARDKKISSLLRTASELFDEEE